MKKRAYAVLGILMLIVLPFFAFGATLRSGDNVSIGSSENIGGDVYMAGGSVISSGVISGDLYAGAGTVIVGGPVSADAVLGGGTVTVTGRIGDDLRIGGGTIIVQGEVGGDALLGGGEITVAGRIGGELYAGGGVVRINAPIAGDVRIGGGEVVINAPIGGNVKIDADKVVLQEGATISGKLTYRSPKEATIAEGVAIGGGIEYEARARKNGRAEFAGFITFALLVKFLTILAGALVAGLVFHKYSVTVTRDVFARPGANFGWGLVTFIVMPVVSVILLVTVIGIPLGIIGLLAFIAAGIFSLLFVPILIGSWLHKKIKKPMEYAVSWKIITLGALAFSILAIIPIIGCIIIGILFLMAFGSTMNLKWQVSKTWR